VEVTHYLTEESLKVLPSIVSQDPCGVRRIFEEANEMPKLEAIARKNPYRGAVIP